MKLAKALVATAFSLALFSPSVIAATKSEQSKQFEFSHDTNYSCSITHDTPTALALGEGNESDTLLAQVTNIDIENNGSTSVTFSATASSPGNDFSMTTGGDNTGNALTDIVHNSVANGDTFDLDIAFADGTIPGAYSAVVTVTCAYTGDEQLTVAQ